MPSSQPPPFRFEPTWDYTVPTWYMNAKFGIFIHWGIYSVPAFDNEWYARNMYQSGHRAFQHHQEKWGQQAQFGYKDFIPLFTADKFDPDSWAELFRKAGAEYVMPVAEHHDGFPMYESALTEWNAARMGPKRDVIGELAQAIRKQQMVFGVSSHRAEHWWFFDGGMRFESDVQDPRYADFYGPAKPAASLDYNAPEWRGKDWNPRPDAKFLDDWLARCIELVDRADCVSTVSAKVRQLFLQPRAGTGQGRCPAAQIQHFSRRHGGL
jgi:alpha-L-fucosidase